MYLGQKSVRKTVKVSVFGVELQKIEFFAFKVSKCMFFRNFNFFQIFSKLENEMLGKVWNGGSRSFVAVASNFRG